MTAPLRGPVHLVGIGGMHMSAIALLLRERGVEVTGSDLRRSALTAKVERAGGVVFEGHDAANLGNPELVVTTAAANDDNPEIAEARRRGIPVILRAEMVARLMEGKRVIAVAGSHGKTTTSSLIAFILREAGRRPMYLLGGESIDLDGHAAWGEGELCVVEADEYKRAFHEYAPAVAVITNVEPDHLDYYGTAEAYQEAFVE
ncbi:UDP-N-acetylmuramate--L-alanine ligase, partial [bacterium]|nr:UDP-N-acetylmuramate--L-alanine ligase [bacterium]